MLKKPLINLNIGIGILLDTITENLRHQDYDHVCTLADDYETYVTGKGYENKLRRFNPREDEDMYKQRVALTQITTPDISGGCIKPMYKIGRTPANKTLHWSNSEKSEENKKTVEDAAKNFYGEQSVDEYLTYRQVDLDSTDPNSFIVVEFKNDNNNVVDPADKTTKAIPYPFEVTSREAVNFVYKNNILQWLIVRNEIYIPTTKEPKAGEKFILYLDNNSVLAIQIDKSMVDGFKSENPNFIPITLVDDTIDDLLPGKVYFYETPGKSNKRFYKIEVFEHKIGFNPARRVGTIPDLTTRKRTCVPLIHQAKPYFEKSIKTISEFDLTNCLHVFPQKIQYSDPCPGSMESIEGTEGFTHVGCNKGMRVGGGLCKACKGSGFKYHQSSQDMLQIRMPKEISEMVSLENVIAYKYPPIELLEFQKKLALYEYRYFAQKAVYNSEVFSKEDVQTATEKIIDLESVYDTLKPFADNYSAMWRHIYKCIASILDLEEGFEVAHVFPSDFKMKPFTALLEDLDKATKNGAPSHIKKAITKDITDKLYVDRPEEILKINTKEKYFPFSGKTENEINFILSNDLCSNYAKLLYANFDQIFSDLEYDASQYSKPINFYKMEEKMQRELIKKKVDEYQLAIDTEDAAATATKFVGGTVLYGPDGVTPVDVDGNPIDLTKFNPDGTPLASPSPAPGA